MTDKNDKKRKPSMKDLADAAAAVRQTDEELAAEQAALAGITTTAPVPPVDETTSVASTSATDTADEDDDDEDVEVNENVKIYKLDIPDPVFDEAGKGGKVPGFSGNELGLMKQVVVSVIRKRPDLNIELSEDTKNRIWAYLPTVKAVEAVFKTSRRIRPVAVDEFRTNAFGGTTKKGPKLGFAGELKDILKYHPELAETDEVKAVQTLLAQASAIVNPDKDDKAACTAVFNMKMSGEDFRPRQQTISKALGVVKRLANLALKAKVEELALKVNVDVSERVTAAMKLKTRHVKNELLKIRWMLKKEIASNPGIITATAYKDQGFDRSDPNPRRQRGGRNREFEKSPTRRRIVLTGSGIDRASEE